MKEQSFIALPLFFLCGFFVSLYFQWSYAFKFGSDWSRLLHLTVDSPLRAEVEPELPGISLSDYPHDGIIFYMLARRPFATKHSHWGTNIAFRYRRILYPLLAGGGGSLSPQATLWGLILVACIGTGLATAALADIAHHFRMSPLVILGVLAHPGVWVSNTILASDSLALGLGLVAISLYLRDRIAMSTIFFALSALTKDVYGLFALGLSLDLVRRNQIQAATKLLVLSALPIVIWALWIHFTFTDRGALGAWGNLSLPLTGIIRAIPRWQLVSTQDAVFSVITLATLVGGVFLVIKSSCTTLRLLTAPWVLLALIVSDWIWNLGNDSIRDLLPLGLFLVVGIAYRFRDQETNQTVTDR